MATCYCLRPDRNCEKCSSAARFGEHMPGGIVWLLVPRLADVFAPFEDYTADDARYEWQRDIYENPELVE